MLITSPHLLTHHEIISNQLVARYSPQTFTLHLYIFFHHSTVAEQGFDNLNEGQQVEYTVDQGGGGGGGKGPRAATVTPL